MRLPIPSDFDGDDWQCVKIQWPNSAMWWGVLGGILTMLARGWTWDEKTGSIKDVQSLMEQMCARNMPFVSCSDEYILQASESTGCVIEVMERELAMSLCGYNPNAFKIENGALYVRDFCGEWRAVGMLGTEAEIPPAGVYDEYDPEPTFYACGKVWSLINALVSLSDAAWGNYADPIVFEQSMRASVPNATLSRARIWQWPPQLTLLDTLYDASTFNDPYMLSIAACRAVDGVQPTGGENPGEVEYVLHSLASAQSEVFGPSPGLDGWYAYWKLAQETIGDTDASHIMALGAIDSTHTCACPDDPAGPDDPTEPTASGFWLSKNFVPEFGAPCRAANNNGKSYGLRGLLAQPIRGYAMKFDTCENSNAIKRMAWLNTLDPLPQVDVSLSNDTSETLPLGYIISTSDTDVAADLAEVWGAAAHTRVAGVYSASFTPYLDQGDVVGLNVVNTNSDFDDLTISEFRAIYHTDDTP